MENTNRVRINVKQQKTGVVFDITAETPTVEESGELLGGALDKVKAVIESKGYALSKNGE